MRLDTTFMARGNSVHSGSGFEMETVAPDRGQVW